MHITNPVLNNDCDTIVSDNNNSIHEISACDHVHDYPVITASLSAIMALPLHSYYLKLCMVGLLSKVDDIFGPIICSTNPSQFSTPFMGATGNFFVNYILQVQSLCLSYPSSRSHFRGIFCPVVQFGLSLPSLLLFTLWFITLFDSRLWLFFRFCQ